MKIDINERIDIDDIDEALEAVIFWLNICSILFKEDEFRVFIDDTKKKVFRFKKRRLMKEAWRVRK